MSGMGGEPMDTTPGGTEETNDALMKVLLADPDNWVTDQFGTYYAGPKMQGDGTIDWSGHDGWPT